MFSYILTFLAGSVAGVAVLMLSALAYSKKVARDKARIAKEKAALDEKHRLEDEAKLFEMLQQLKRGREQIEQLRQTLPPKPPPPVDNAAATVKERLHKAIELTRKQSYINVRGDNEKQLEYNNLELEKLSILKTILADGYDPPITIRFNSGDQEMSLSSYVANLQKTLN